MAALSRVSSSISWCHFLDIVQLAVLRCPDWAPAYMHRHIDDTSVAGYPGLYEQPFQCSLHGGFHQKGRLKHLFPRSEQVSGCSVCSWKEQKKVPPPNFESFSSLVSSSFETPGWFGFPRTCWCRSAASQREPLFPHLFSLSPLMISSDRHDS